MTKYLILWFLLSYRSRLLVSRNPVKIITVHRWLWCSVRVRRRFGLVWSQAAGLRISIAPRSVLFICLIFRSYRWTRSFTSAGTTTWITPSRATTWTPWWPTFSSILRSRRYCHGGRHVFLSIYYASIHLLIGRLRASRMGLSSKF